MNHINTLLLTLIIILIIFMGYNIQKTCKIENYKSRAQMGAGHGQSGGKNGYGKKPPCPANTYYARDTMLCISCPDGTISDIGSVGRQSCEWIKSKKLQPIIETKPVMEIKPVNPVKSNPFDRPKKPNKQPVGPGYPGWRPGMPIGKDWIKNSQVVCRCPGGTPAIGEDCYRRGATECSECNPGYVMNKKCIRKRPPTRPTFPSKPTEQERPDSTCPKGKTFMFGRCRLNRCRCRGGFPARGEECHRYGENKCTRCFKDREMKGGKCIVKNNENYLF